MSIERASFEDVSEADLHDLIQAGRPEGLTIEYKRDPYGDGDRDKKEALKDITSFANSAGGHLIIGVEEANGVPTALTGLPGVNLGAQIDRFESLIRDGVEPRITGVRLRRVSHSGGEALVIRIPRSWNLPHRVTTGGHSHFYLRNSGGAHPADVEELRVLFTLGAEARHRIKAFRFERIETVGAGRGPVLLPANGRLFVHLVPLSAFGQANEIDLERAFEARMRFLPIGLTDVTTRYNLDGLINVGARGGRDIRGYTQVFRNGSLEATHAGIVGESGGITIFSAGASNIVEVLPSYFEGLRVLDVPPPIVVMISYEGAMGARLGIEFDPLFGLAEMEPLPPVDPLLLPEVIVEDYYGSLEECARALRPIFDALWNAAGFARCTYYDRDGNWRPPR